MKKCINKNSPVFVISIAAELTNMHPQTLRQYDKIGLVSPSRSSNKLRLYSIEDIDQLREIQKLSQDGITLAGIRHIFKLNKMISDLEDQVNSLAKEVKELKDKIGSSRSRIFVEGHGEIVRIPNR